MTLEELKNTEAATVNIADIAEILGCTPQTIRVAARQRPDLLGFPIIIMGSRVRIPRIPFIQFIEGAEA